VCEARDSHHLPDDAWILFIEVRPGDGSDFSDVLSVHGAEVDRYHILRCVSPAIPDAIAAILLHARDVTGQIPHAYFGWTERNPIVYLLKFLAFGEGDTAPVTREVLRQTEPNPLRRPRIHVGWSPCRRQAWGDPFRVASPAALKALWRQARLYSRTPWRSA
jgi:hypothetical protein